MTSLLNKTWKIKTAYEENTSLLERVCNHRDLDLESEITEFHSPWTLKDIDKAVERLQKAIKNEERIMIFGDYDVDGVCGASILYLGLKELGTKVSVRLPHREKDGYGLNTKVLGECKELGVSVVITTDCGISNVQEVEHGNQLGLDIIITDHHSIPPVLPKAYAILNPHQKDCQYPEENICGTVVALKLLQALQEKSQKSHATSHQSYLDLAALATVADCMPLTGENRLIVKQGLIQMGNTQHRGLRTLADSYELTKDQRRITSYDLGFKIAPCINAAGRLEDPLIALKMMMGDQEAALYLRNINQERQQIVQTALEQASEQVERDHADDPILIFWADNWQPGIVGLLAGRLCERYHKPTICLTQHEEKYVGSCRSIPEINIVEQLQKHEDLFLNYGGHAQAAGLSIAPENLEVFRERMIRDIAEFIKEHPITPYLSVDTEISTEEVSLGTTEVLAQLEPFGMGNPKPKFLLKNLTILETRVVGRDQTHLQLFLEKGQQSFKAIAFQMAEHEKTLQDWKTVDLVCQLNKNEWNGSTTVDLQIADARATQREH